MAHCPDCRFEYHERVRVCPDCGKPLERGPLPPEVEHPIDPETALVRLCRISDPNEAEILKAILGDAGIPALVQEHGPFTGELARVVDGATHDYAYILVSRNRLEEAARVLHEVQTGPFEWPEGMEPDDSEVDWDAEETEEET
ncbi:MAG: DUF2007 domain-containing protein [Armatimonadetes bacterium]|nr:DUF2007 domain-containing protein [Armatimonadota bacterium]